MTSEEERDVMGKMMTTEGEDKEARKTKGRRSLVHNPGALHLLQVTPCSTLKFLTGPLHFAHLEIQDISCHPLVVCDFKMFGFAIIQNVHTKEGKPCSSKSDGF